MGLNRTGVLWKKFNAEGEEYFTGVVEGLINARLVIMPNKPREGQTLNDKSPTHVILVGTDDEE